MPSNLLPEMSDYALLSTASAAGETDNPGLLDVGGKPFIFQQINALREFGIKNFLVEVDAIPSALLSLADTCGKDGCAVEFVRTAHEVLQKMQPGGRLIVMGEGVFASPVILAQIFDAPPPALLTLDGRDENVAFERIDLNTRWAGLAVVDLATIHGLATLPEGWSLASSILRQTLQVGTVQQIPLKQKSVQDGDLILANSQAGIELVTNRLLQHRMGEHRGIIEKYVFAPVSARLASWLWRVDEAPSLLFWSIIGLSLATVILAVLNLAVAAAASAFLALFLNIMRKTESGTSRFSLGRLGTDELLTATGIVAMVMLSWLAEHALIEALLPVTAISCAMLVATRSGKPGILGAILHSKAAVALGLLALVPFAGILTALKILALGYLLVLGTITWREKIS